MSEHMSRKKNALLTRKEALLNEIKYYRNKVEEARSASTNYNFIADDSSDSEQEFTVDIGPSIIELKQKQGVLKTCLRATQELTDLTILQSEVNVLVEDPVLNKEAPVNEEGVWREVTAECRIDLVPFSISFYVHKPTRMFGPKSYRNLQVTPVKLSHKVELSRSVFTTVTRPSDAIEMIRNYSAAHRSRRTTLAWLAEKFSETLYMEPMPEGGFILKCAGLMEVQWTLQNKWSPIAPFHHRMVFDLEFMDESYIKIISQLHKQLIDPTLEPDERTQILAKIINTCLEAKSSNPNQCESTESESETAEKLRSRRTTLDQEPEAPERNKKKHSEVMAPPKSIPKKSKPKGKENAVSKKVKPVKRTANTKDTVNAKKSKTIDLKNSEVKITSKKSIIEKVNKEHYLQNDVELNNAQQTENFERIVVDNNSKNSENATKKDRNKYIDKQRNQQKIKDKISKINDINYDKETEKNNVVNKKKTQHVTEAVAKKTNNKEDRKRNKESTDMNKDIHKNIENKKESKIDYKKQKNSLPINFLQSSKQTKSNDNYLPETLKRKNLTQKGSKENITEKITKSNKQKLKEVESKAEKNKGNIEKKIKEKVTQPKNQLKPNKDIKEKEINTNTKLPHLVKNNKEVTKKPNTINYIKNQFLPRKTQGSNKVFASKIPRISPRKLLNLKPIIQDISKSSKGSQKSLQRVTNIPRLMKKPPTFKPKV